MLKLRFGVRSRRRRHLGEARTATCPYVRACFHENLPERDGVQKGIKSSDQFAQSESGTSPTSTVTSPPSPHAFSMSAAASSDRERQMLAANWPEDILQKYLADVEKDREAGIDDEELEDISSDEEMESVADSSFTSNISHTSHISRIPFPDDIASDDDAFSSDDEFAEDDMRDKQRLRKELVLGRPPEELLGWSHKELVRMYEAYLKQLDDADAEVNELTASAREPLVRRGNTVEYKAPLKVDTEDIETAVKELRMRSPKEVIETESKGNLIQSLVILAQSLFRRERQIKGILFRMEEDDDE